MVLGRSRAADIVTDGAWSANWRFASAGTDHVGDDLTSPLQHYWSLAAEEQFSVLWPCVILTASAIAVRLAHRRRAVVLPAVVAWVTVASFTDSW